jgi:hypothetical protein
MPIIFVCPLCRHRVKVSRRFKGVSRDCPACRGTVTVPDPASGAQVEVSDIGSEDEVKEKEEEELLKRFAASPRPPASPADPAPPPVTTPSRARVTGASSPRPPHTLQQAVCYLALLALVVFLISRASTSERTAPRQQETSQVAGDTSSDESTPDEPAARPVNGGRDPRKPVVINDEADVGRVLDDARRLEGSGFEPLAAERLEDALEVPHTPRSQERLREARDALFARCRLAIDSACGAIRRAAFARDMVAARSMLDSLSDHVPESLRGYANAAVAKINAALREKWGEGLEGDPRDLERYLRARPEIDVALGNLDVATAKRVVARLDGGNVDPLTISNLELDRQRVAAVTRLETVVRTNLGTLVGTEVALPLRAGSEATGVLTRAEGEEVALRLASGGQRVVRLGELASKQLFESSRAGDDEARFGLAVVNMCRGELRAAADVLAGLRDYPGASKLLSELAKAPEPLSIPERQRPPSSEGKPVTVAAKQAPPPPPPPPPRPRHAPDWAKDTSGSVSWDDAYVVESEHYLLKTNVRRANAERYSRFLEALCERFAQVFEFTGNDLKYKKNEVVLYASHDEFARYEAKVIASSPVNPAGFYEPSSKRLVTFQGPDANGSADSTLSVLAHEATHQFENLVLRKMDQAPTFMIEGLAVFFQTPQFRDNGDIVVGAIPQGFLASLQRSIRANDTIPLKDVIRTPHMSFTGVHYAHAWGIIHWLMYGPERKKSQKLLDWYWQLCLERTTSADDFEEGLAKMGYTMSHFEESWREWILSLDPEKDPAVALYEERRHRK